MRSLPAAVLVVALALAACGDDDDDDGRPRAQATTTTTSGSSSTSSDDGCAGADPVPPDGADGEPAEIVASVGGLTFALVDHGASVDVVSVYRTVDCAYEAVNLDGVVSAFSVGGSVTHGDGIRCEGGQVTALSATSDDGETYQATAITYEVRGNELVEVSRDASTIEASTDADTLAAYYRLDC